MRTEERPAIGKDQDRSISFRSEGGRETHPLDLAGGLYASNAVPVKPQRAAGISGEADGTFPESEWDFVSERDRGEKEREEEPEDHE
ncbi:MAG: hypothetical protein ACXW5U_18885 [Thermoanaerobaculia bacterium]